MIVESNWQRVSRRRPCPVCAKLDWCLYAGDADAPTAAICARMESDRRCGDAGWLHVLRHNGPVWTPWRRTIGRAVRMMTTPEPSEIDFDRLAAECQAAMKPQALGRLADSLGLTVDSLQRLSAGWFCKHQGWTFPMKNPSGKVLGIRLRLPSGRKLAIRGGREGLFIPEGQNGAGVLLVCEGPTDSAALLDLGFDAIGRPSCTGGVRLLVELVQQTQTPEVVVVGDGDGPGQRGAENLAAVLVAYCESLKVIRPPVGIKDGRHWKQHGATHQEVQAVIDAAPVRGLSVHVRQKGGKSWQKIGA